MTNATGRADLVARSEAIARERRAALDAATTLEELADAEREYLGKSSPLNEVREAIKTVDGADRAEVGKAMSVARRALEELLATRRDELTSAARPESTVIVW